MLFGVEADLGYRVSGFLVPDEGTEPARLRALAGGQTVLMFEARDVRRDLVAAGRPPGGRCGFRIDDTMLPHLAAISDLDLQEAVTNVSIYRRRRLDSTVPLKLLRLETHLLPLWALDDALDPCFGAFYKGIERLGRETVTQILTLPHTPSLFASGRLPFGPYHGLVKAAGFKIAILLRDPYEELAERLLVLSRAGTSGDGLLDARDRAAFGNTIDYLAGLELDQPAAIVRAFRRLPDTVAASLANPLTRMLTVDDAEWTAAPESRQQALDVLAGFDLVGLREWPEQFLGGLQVLTGRTDIHLPSFMAFSSVTLLAERLRTLAEVRFLIARDLQVYRSVKQAYQQLL